MLQASSLFEEQPLQSTPERAGSIVAEVEASPQKSKSSLSSEKVSWAGMQSSSNGRVKKRETKQHKPYPITITNELEAVLRSDSTTSVEFKWKSSKLLCELRQLMDQEKLTQSGSDDSVMDIFARQSKQLTTTQHISPRTSLLECKQDIPPPTVQDQSSRVAPLEVPHSVSKVYHCTFPRCNYAFSSPVDWKRHEEKDKHRPQKRYMCLECPVSTTTPRHNLLMCKWCALSFPSLDQIKVHNLGCSIAQSKGTTFARKEKLADYLRDDHEIVRRAAMQRTTAWCFAVDSEWPRECGFYGIYFSTWEIRASHLVELHFKKGTKIDEWRILLERIIGQMSSL
jgi:hypothetical protein